jgi:signal transduction histidine kinase
MNMSERGATRLARGIGLCSLGTVTAALVLLVLDLTAIDSIFTAQLPSFLKAVITAVLGALIASRRPRNPIGWLLLAISAAQAASLLGDFIAMRALLSGASPGGWVAWPGWIESWTGMISSVLLSFLVLFFPDGRLPGPHWRWVAWFIAVVAFGILLASMLSTVPITLSTRVPNVPNPLVVPALSGIANSASAVFNSLAVSVIFLLPAAGVMLRLRRAQGVERQQVKWFAATAIATLVVAVTGGFLSAVNPAVGSAVSDLGFLVGFAVVTPAMIGLAVMKYGLYDIDLFISRALGYGSLAVFITAVYVGIAVGIGTLVGSGGKPNLALSILATAVVAIGFQPVRERVQKIANRLVYGQRATPYEVLSEFAGRVAETYAADEVLPRMARVLQEGTGAQSATVWLRGNAELRPAATFPEALAAHEAMSMRNGTLPALPGATRAVEVRHQGELLGALSVSKRRGETMTPIEEKLVDDLAHQAGLVLKNVGLSADLQVRLDELRISRQRLVSAQDLERRRLERNLHDGAQQHLVALKVKLGLVQVLLLKAPDQAMATIAQLKEDADDALETLRDLARGIYPPLLAEKGLVVALESQARKATVAVTVQAVGVQRYPQDVEATVYFCVLEALQNVQKYAAATCVIVSLHTTHDILSFEVTDDGTGFDTATARTGTGLTNMGDRLDALGGRVMVTSRLGAGTSVRGELPLATAPTAAV